MKSPNGKKISILNMNSLLVQAAKKPITNNRKKATIRVLDSGRNSKKSSKAQAAPEAIQTESTAKKIEISLNLASLVELERDPDLVRPKGAAAFLAIGDALLAADKLKAEALEIHIDVEDSLLEPLISGLEVALYRFRSVSVRDWSIRVFHKKKSLSSSALETLSVRGQSINLARHLVNLPPNRLYPESFVQLAKENFKGAKNLKIEVWDERRLEKEGMGLHLGVGQGSKFPPRLLILSYRPRASDRRAPVALVGKGITFDSGGLDLKPSSGMRLMKKDMGGSAAVMGIMNWAVKSGLDYPLDAYLALAENSVSENSFRPSDVLRSRNGLEVEIHNTDAEGRLVLADAMDVAVTAKIKPRCLIDLATLTGAIKVGLGAKVAGLFSNNQELRDQLVLAARASGDWAWPMPLVQAYAGSMKSNYADLVNSVDGFGGAITAALFLEKFSAGIPWAHLDIYAWKDSAEGCFLESGGSGQGVLLLTEWLTQLVD